MEDDPTRATLSARYNGRFPVAGYPNLTGETPERVRTSCSPAYTVCRLSETRPYYSPSPSLRRERERRLKALLPVPCS